MLGRKKKTPTKKVYEDDASVIGEHAPTIHDLMTLADGIEVGNSEIYVSPSGFTKTYYVIKLPQTVHFGYLNRFFNIGADVHIAIHVDPGDSALAIAKRTKLMTQVHSSIIQEEKAGTNKEIATNQERYQLLEREREEIRLGMQRLFYVTLIFTVSSPDRREFESACERIEREGFEGFDIREAYKQHDLGLRSVAPLGVNALREPIEMTASALANAFPFSNAHFSHEYGVPIGVDWTNGHLNRYDAWHPSLANHNMLIIGTSGGGKSFLSKGLVARSAPFGIRQVIVDYDGSEYTPVVQALGGVTIQISEHSPYKFNPFELSEEEKKLPDGTILKTVEVKDKISEMERLIITMAHLFAETDRLDAYTTSSINLLLQEMYMHDFGFVQGDPDSLYEQKTRMHRDAKGDRLVLREKRLQPRFSDFYAKLENAAKEDPRLGELVMRLRRFREDGTEGMFDCYSNIELEDAPIIQFDLSSLSEKSMARKLGMQIILEWIIEKFVKVRADVRKRVIIDEAQKMLDSEDQAAFLEDVYRRIRKRSGQAVAASQDFLKFAENEHGRAIIQNSASKVLLKQAKSDKEAVIQMFGLEDQEFDDLVGFRKGMARWIVGEEVFYNQLNAFQEEAELFSTTFAKSEHELALQRRQLG